MNETSNFTPLEERLANLTVGINGMADGQKILVNKAFLEHVRDDMVDLLALRSQNNTPLTLDELRQMKGEPVYLVFDYMPEHRNGWYEFLRVVNGKYLEFRGWEILLEQLGCDVIAYRRKPKEDT